MARATGHRVEAIFDYLADGEVRPRYFLYRPDAGEPPPVPARAKHRMPVLDARERLDALSLDGPGVVLVHQASAVPDFYDAEAVRTRYYSEVAELVGTHTGAERVHVFDHNVRCEPRARRGEGEAARPVRFVHNDYTERSGPQRVRELLPREAQAWLGGRFAIVNVWRPIRDPVREMPLAVCDAATLAPGDLVATDLCYRDRTGEIYSVRHRPEHRWLYFPEMRPEEVMLLKCYDSLDDGRARFTAHSAFVDPESPPDAPPRESIEVRALVFFGSPG